MILKSLHIISFGGLRNRDIDLDCDLNVIFGANESGKSSAAMFIKFIFYGLSGKSQGGIPSERKRYVNRETGQAAGYITAVTKSGEEYRLERAIITSDNAAPRERVRIINHRTGEVITGQNPGEYFFGVPEEVFVDTCFISQSADIRPSVGKSGKEGAVKNLLTSANENVDIKKAVSKLDEVRRGLFHKHKNGGEIKELSEKRAKLAAELEVSREKSQEIINLTATLEDVKKRLQTLEESRTKYEGIIDALDKINLARKIDALSEAEEDITILENEIASIDNSVFGEGFHDALAESERDIHLYDEKCAEYDSMLSGEGRVLSEPVEIPNTDEIIDEIHSVDSTSRIQFTVAISLLVAGIIGLAAVFFLYYFNTDMYMLPLIMTVALVTIGIVFIIKHARTNSILSNLLDEWDAQSIDEIENAVAEKLSSLGQSQVIVNDRESVRASIENSKLRFDVACERISNFAQEASIEESDDVYETIDALRAYADEIMSEREEKAARLQNLHGRIAILTEQLDGVDYALAKLDAESVLGTYHGSVASTLDNAEEKNVRRERDFTENAIRASQKQKSDLESRLSLIGRPTADPDYLATALDGLDETIKELTLRHDACELAMQAIKTAGESMRSNVIPAIAARASKIISEARGDGDAVVLDASFGAGISSGDDVITSEFLSRGTSDLSYIALRIAIAEEVFAKEPPVMVFDESFAHIDRDRTEAAFKLLTGNQYVILTCRSDDTAAAEHTGANIINL